MPEPVILVANGDLRLSANQKCWPAQSRVEDAVMAAIRGEGFDVPFPEPSFAKSASRPGRCPRAAA